jgi:hypothetical protein
MEWRFSTLVMSPKQSKLRIRMYYSPADDLTRSLVFVHGLRGHPQRTWTTESSPARRSVRKGPSRNPLNRLFSRSSGSPQYSPRREIFWPKHLLAQDIQNIRVMTFGYDAEISTALSRTANSSIFTVARDLVVRLQMKREDSGKVCNSHIAHGITPLSIASPMSL